MSISNGHWVWQTFNVLVHGWCGYKHSTLLPVDFLKVLCTVCTASVTDFLENTSTHIKSLTFLFDLVTSYQYTYYFSISIWPLQQSYLHSPSSLEKRPVPNSKSSSLCKGDSWSSTSTGPLACTVGTHSHTIKLVHVTLLAWVNLTAHNRYWNFRCMDFIHRALLSEQWQTDSAQTHEGLGHAWCSQFTYYRIRMSSSCWTIAIECVPNSVRLKVDHGPQYWHCV